MNGAAWYLILTLWGSSSTIQGPVAIQQVGPFATVEACKKAGQMWLDQKRTSHNTPSALCVSDK